MSDETPPTTKIFSLASCHWLGFDLDHTLIRYRLNELHQLIYRSMCEYLIDHHHYNRQLLDIPYDHLFAVKALIYDNLYGNLIQLTSNGFVHTALHGVNQRLSSKEIEKIYAEPFPEIEEDSTKRFLCIFTYFDHSVSYLIANLVEMIDQKKLYDESSMNEKDFSDKYSFFLKDLRDGFDYLFKDFNRGNYFLTIKQNPGKFIYERDDVREWLEKLRQNNQRLFLATNSQFDYTELLCNYAFGHDWQNLFDLIIVDCKKPSFFTSKSDPNKRPFQQSIVHSASVDDIVKDFPAYSLYTFGNSGDLHEVMSRISGIDPIVIYFGDHIKSDINALKRHTNWLAAVVVEELEYDIPPLTIHTSTHHPVKSSSNSSYQIGNQSKYFSSFFTVPSESIIFDNDETQPDVLLKSLSSYWYTYITKHAHLSVSCLSVLANQFDYDHQFKHNEQIQHLIVTNNNNNNNTKDRDQ